MPPAAQTIRLKADEVQRRLTTRSLGRSLHLFDEITSTNDAALTLASAKAADGTAVLAEGQTAGKGRLGRRWDSPPHLNIYCSVILNTFQFSRNPSWMPLVTGLALSEAIQESCAVRLALKWPNDLLCRGKKIGGVLCESSSQGQENLTCVVGFGINVNGRGEDFPDDLRSIATSIHQETQKFFDRNTLVADVFNRLENWYDAVKSGQFERIRKSYTEACATLGRDVRVSCTDGTTIQGTALDVGRDGALLVSTGRRNRPFEAQGGHFAAQGRSHIVEIRAADVQHLR